MIPTFPQSWKLNKYSSILLLLVEIINLDPETGLQNVLPIKRNDMYKKHHFAALAKKITKPRTWTEVPSSLQTVKKTLVHSTQTDVSTHVTLDHHLLNQSLILNYESK